MTPGQIHKFVIDATKPPDWTLSEAYRTWRRFLDDLGERHGVALDQRLSSADDAFALVEAGADGDQIAAVFSLLFS